MQQPAGRFAHLETLRFLMRCVLYRLHTESLQIRTLLSLNLEGATVIDIGANKGIYSYWLSRQVSGSGKVLAFEPQPEMAGYIALRMKHLKLANIEVFNFALSERAGSAELARKRIGDGSASMQQSRWQDGAATIQVPTASLDEMDFHDIRYVKCDVEGHEMQVLHGARHLIERDRPIVQVESTPSECAVLFRFFESRGYLGLVFLNEQYLPCRTVHSVAHRKFGHGGHRDFFFFPSDAVGATVPESLYRKFPQDCELRN